MAPASKRGPAPRAKHVKRPAGPPSRPFLRFHHAEGLRRRTLSALGALEAAPDDPAHRRALADVVVELTNCGLDSYFMEPLKRAKAGFIVQQTANLGLAGARQVMGSVVRKILDRMDGPQLVSVCGSIRGFMR
jgi:hypothetical protein